MRNKRGEGGLACVILVTCKGHAEPGASLRHGGCFGERTGEFGVQDIFHGGGKLTSRKDQRDEEKSLRDKSDGQAFPFEGESLHSHDRTGHLGDNGKGERVEETLAKRFSGRGEGFCKGGGTSDLENCFAAKKRCFSKKFLDRMVASAWGGNKPNANVAGRNAPQAWASVLARQKGGP